MKKIAIIGGGSSGMMAAISAAEAMPMQNEIIIFERNARVGKKLLATGNGRCNLTNKNVTPENFQRNGEGLIGKIIDEQQVEKTLKFFEDCGLKCKETPGGRIYPYHEQASAVLDVLRFKMNRTGILVIAETKITKVTAKSQGGFKLSAESTGSENKRSDFDCDKLIISTGGMAAPKTGSDGNGFDLMASLGHRILKATPALTQLKTDNTITKSLSGIKVNAGLSAKSRRKTLKYVIGEIIFTAYGLSGSAVFDISGTALATEGDVDLCIDFLPEIKPTELLDILLARRSLLMDLPLEEFFTGFINKRIGQSLIKQICNLHPGSTTAEISDREINDLAKILKNCELRLRGHTGWDNAQTNYGGLCPSEFDPNTLESRIVPGLYATGELFGFAGQCGGFNLQWAWSSGMVSGKSAAISAAL